MLAELSIASAETIARRLTMMATGNCSPTEYRRMVAEKMEAARRSWLAALNPLASMSSLLAPWHKAASRNARRLRTKR
jgi:hypothetical protein